MLERGATNTPRQDARVSSHVFVAAGYCRSGDVGANWVANCLQVLDEENNDVTPQPLYKADPGAVQDKGSRFFVEEICAESASDQITATGSFTRPFSRYHNNMICEYLSQASTMNQSMCSGQKSRETGREVDDSRNRQFIQV